MPPNNWRARETFVLHTWYNKTSSLSNHGFIFPIVLFLQSQVQVGPILTSNSPGPKPTNPSKLTCKQYIFVFPLAFCSGSRFVCLQSSDCSTICFTDTSSWRLKCWLTSMDCCPCYVRLSRRVLLYIIITVKKSTFQLKLKFWCDCTILC